MAQMNKPFTEGQYPSAMGGMVRGFDIALLESRRKKAEDEKQREEFIMMMMQRAYEEEQLAEKRAYEEAQEAEERKYGEGQSAIRRQHEMDMETRRQGGRVTLKKTPRPQGPAPAPKPEARGKMSDQEKALVNSYYKDRDDANALRTKIASAQRGWRGRGKPNTELVNRLRRIEDRMERLRPRVNEILGTEVPREVGANVETGAPMYEGEQTGQQVGFTMTTPEGQTISREPGLVAWLVLQGKSQEEIRAAVKDWRSRGGK